MVSSKFEPFENWLPPGYIISEGHRRGPVPRIILANSVTVPVLHDRANFSKSSHFSVIFILYCILFSLIVLYVNV